jgi:hypothetical protein
MGAAAYNPVRAKGGAAREEHPPSFRHTIAGISRSREQILIANNCFVPREV